MKRSTGTTHRIGTITQVMVVAVLFLAVVWQINGVTDGDPVEVAPVDRAPIQDEVTRPYVTTDDVNLRRGPGTDHEVITVVPLHAEVLVTGGGQNGFVPVEVGGTSAWVSEAYVVPEGSVLGGTTEDVPVLEVPAPTEPPAVAVEEEPVEIAAEEPLPDEPVVEEEEPPVAALSAPVEEAPVVALSAPVEETGVEPVPTGERWVDVDRSTGIVTLYEGERVVDQFTALLGKDPSPDGFYSTATGTFHVHMMNRELTETPFAEGVFLTHFVGFDWERSNGFHSPTKDAEGNVIQTGGTTTLGCVRLGEEEAIRMYEFAFIGMRVEVHD